MPFSSHGLQIDLFLSGFRYIESDLVALQHGILRDCKTRWKHLNHPKGPRDRPMGSCLTLSELAGQSF